MTSALLNLRKQAGFKNAKDFAAAEGIAEATYARYESSPEKIPLKSAWQLADRFNVSIDVIVGREHVDVASLRGRVQEAYEALSERSRASLDDYLAFLAQRDEREAREREADECRHYDAVCYRLEQVFLSGLEEEDPDLFAFGTGECMRSAFEAFVNRRADELQEPDVRTSAKRIMAAYDRAHSTFRYGDNLVRATTVDICNHYIAVEHNDTDRRKEGGA